MEAVSSEAAGWWSVVSRDEAGWGSWWPGAHKRTGSGVASPATVPLDLAERRPEAKGKPKPNVFFIMIDDMGWNDIGYQSTDLHAVTPNLNRMAAAGVRLSQYYSMPICTPARAALMTGRYSIRYGFQYSIIYAGAAWGIPFTEKLLPEYMNEAGYTSHMVGKWHLGDHTEAHLPHRRGFETHLGYLSGAETYWTHQISWNVTPTEVEEQMEPRETFLDFGFGNETGYYRVTESRTQPLPLPYREQFAPAGEPSDETVSAGLGPTGTRSSRLSPSSRRSSSSSPSLSSSSVEVAGKYSTQIFAERALEIVKGKSPFDESPLFLYLAHQAVHDPLGLPPADAFSAEELAVLDALEDSPVSALRLRFAKVLMYLDKTIGQLVDYLEEEGWLENSVIVVASDNGGCASDGGSNLPLRGVKNSYWEGGIKVPAFVYSPSHIPEEQWGQEYAGLMHVTDWLPTIATVADFEPSGSNGDLDGVSHAAIWGKMPTTGGEGGHEASTPSVRKNDDGFGGGGGACEGSGDPDGSINRGSIAYSPRSEILHNFDPYFLGANQDHTISDPDFAHPVGGFRHGKWKFMFNICCLGYYDPNSYPSSPKTKSAREGEVCPEEVYTAFNKTKTSAPGENPTPNSASSRCYKYGCAEACVYRGACTDWLFDIEQDPLEEHNLVSIHPEVRALGQPILQHSRGGQGSAARV
eukprot:g13881.t2